MQWIIDLFTNYWLMSAVFSWLSAQILKICFGIFKVQKFTLTRALFGTGGMPSSHTAAVTGLCTACAVSGGFGTLPFAVSALFCMVVVTDALGVRRETGLQSKMLNELMEKHPEEEYSVADRRGKKFKELIGHTPFQVAVGAALGIMVANLVHLIPCYAV